MVPSATNDFDHDLWRTVILGNYIRYWGLPELRIVSQKDSHRVEIYSFPPLGEGKVHRIATVGASYRSPNHTSRDYEFLLTTAVDFSGSSFDEASALVMDVVAYFVQHNLEPIVDHTLKADILMPGVWPTRALLIDEPRGEAEELASFHVGGRHLDLIWLVPIYQEEYEFILSKGIEEFGEREDAAEWSAADPLRSSFL